MQPNPSPRAPAAREKLAAAEAGLAGLEADVGVLALDASEGRAGAEKALAAHRGKIETAERQVSEMRRAVALASHLDQKAAAAAAASMRVDQLAEFKKAMTGRDKSMARVLELFGAAAKEYGRYSEATLAAQIAVPVGTVIPVMAIGPNGLYGPAFGPCERLVLAELYRLAPERQDGVGRFVFSFCKPSSEQTRGQPAAIKPGIDELLAADNAIIAEIEAQVEKLNAQAMRAAEMIPADRKDVAA
jgi:hypothetical protein